MRRFGAVLATVALGLSLTAGSASARTGKPKMTVKPNVAIVNGTRLDVVARHLLPDSAHSVYECTSDYAPPFLTDCTLLKKNATGPTGTLHVRVKAIVGAVGSEGGVCDADHSCLIITFINNTTHRPITAPISFAA
jgi:hypothetical protein